MADQITLANAFTISGPANTFVKQDVADAIDVSGYDIIDLQVSLLAVNNATGMSITFLTSMQNKSDDNSWTGIGTTSTMTTTPSWTSISLPSSGALLRWLRFEVLLVTSTTSATISITGLARRSSL